MKIKNKPKKVSATHYVRLLFRCSVFLIGLYWYIATKFDTYIFTDNVVNAINNHYKLIHVVLGIAYTLEMLLRLLPNSLESRGAQKHFKKNYQPTGSDNIVIEDSNAAGMAAIAWIIPNIIIGILYLTGIFDRGMLILCCLLYGVCDFVCILFICPFQVLFLKNRCCNTCRIYNWDYAFMFTPLIFIPSPYTLWLLGLALAILIKWEVSYYFAPERFSDKTNAYIKCENCTEKLCLQKKHINVLRRKLRIGSRKKRVSILHSQNTEITKKEDDQ